jgi:hypothetical protein
MQEVIVREAPTCDVTRGEKIENISVEDFVNKVAEEIKNRTLN